MSSEPRRAVVVVSLVFSVLVLALALAAPLLVRALGIETTQEQAAAEAAEVGVDLSDVVTFEIEDRVHTLDAVEYPQSPPAGGPHAPQWLDCGVYDEVVPEENVVHDLEHGTIWITHDPELDDDEVAELAAQLPDNGILSPYPGLDAPVVVTVWNAQLALTGADDERLGLFIDKYGDGHTSAEPDVGCFGGIDPDDLPGTGKAA